MNFNVIYYVPTIPDVWSTDRYQHALALIERADNSLLIGNNPPPSVLQTKASKTVILDSSGVLAKASQAADIVRKEIRPDGIYVTSYHYEAALSGLLAHYRGITWVPDVYETPAQYRLNNPRSYHQVTSRGLEAMLNRAERTIHSFHPKTPYQYGSDRHFLTNGAPVSQIDPSYLISDSLSIVWVGSPRIDRGGEILVKAVSQLNSEFEVEVYGKIDQRLISLAKQYGVQKQIHQHGWVTHNEALQAINRADVGFAVLPPRTDWLYAPAIKIGEYLACGTIPLVSDFPGSRYIAGNAGVYVEPSGDSVAKALIELDKLSTDERLDRMRRARHRGETISWESIRSSFANHIGLNGTNS
ncbi:glycosyltransferase [Saliphagus sp. GCM10025334]